jgi:phosphatidylglycerol:prolipoprotein diacylglycerol transferase
MFPVLFKILNFELRSYGVALAISILLAIWISLKRASRFGVKQNYIIDIALVIMISAIVGSRLW